jgi:hypothetical protein
MIAVEQVEKLLWKGKRHSSRSGWLSSLRRCLPHRWQGIDPRAWLDLQLVC